MRRNKDGARAMTMAVIHLPVHKFLLMNRFTKSALTQWILNGLRVERLRV